MDSDLFKVLDTKGNKHLDRSCYFHCIARLVDPDNGHLVAKTKTHLRTLNVKDFGFDVKKMLAEFKNLKTRVADLGGDYSNNDQFLDLWASVRTMQEKEFTRFVRDLQDQEARKPKANRQTIEAIIRDIADKQTRMETENEWNIMSLEDSMIMALAGYIKSTELQANNKTKKKSQGSEQSTKKSNDSGDNKPKSKEI